MQQMTTNDFDTFVKSEVEYPLSTTSGFDQLEDLGQLLDD
jgi:hypothetical protein